MVSQIQSNQNDTIRLLMAEISDMENSIDAMLFRKIIELRRKVSDGTLNPKWVGHMLQCATEGKRSAELDLILRPKFVTLKQTPD